MAERESGLGGRLLFAGDGVEGVLGLAGERVCGRGVRRGDGDFFIAGNLYLHR